MIITIIIIIIISKHELNHQTINQKKVKKSV